MPISWSYVAGFFDGEGSITVVTRRVESTSCITVTLTQSAEVGTGRPPSVLTAVREFLSREGIRCGMYEGKIYHGCRLTDGRTVRANRVPWAIYIQNRAGVTAFLTRALPYLRVKHTKAQDVLRFLQLFPSMSGRFSQKKFADVDRVAMRHDREAGLAYHEIAAKYGMSVTAVYERLNNEKITAYRQEWRRKRRTMAAAPQEA